MRRLVPSLVIVGCLLGLLSASYGPVLFLGRQFGYRDAAHFYYPLYQLVEKEWDAGRWPLWEPEENAGMPLLGNPTAAVLYPGKLIYRALPYAWGARLYVVAHTVLAFAGMVALLRSWGTSGVGAALGGLGYAFGAPILFQYCNIIFLVGAAWTPLGFLAVDRWLRLGSRRALLGLAVVLAMQTLGGDPESSYLTGVCAGGYALGLAWQRGRSPRPARWRGWWLAVAGVPAAVAWVAVTIEAARRLPALRPPHKIPLALPWMPWVPPVVLALWGLLGLILLIRWLRAGRVGTLVPMLAGLVGAAMLAGCLAAAQLLPVLEFTGQSGRAAGGGPHDIYPFSLEPIRVVELIWPNVFGTHFHGNRSWMPAAPLVGQRAKIWVPSLYLGGLTIVLGLGAFGFRDGPPWRAWLSGVAIASLLASFGEYTGPLCWVRRDPRIAAQVGPNDPSIAAAIRRDSKLRDGDGGVYWLLATTLPGFKQFRFPSKLLSFTSLALAGLAALGWDRAMAGGRGRRRTVALALGLLVASLAALAFATARHDAILKAFLDSPAGKSSSSFGPFDASGALRELIQALVQGAAVSFVAAILALRGWRRPGLAGAGALIVLAADLAAANARSVITVPQALFETKPKALEIIEAAERERPASTPFRIHRMPIWNPLAWMGERSSQRVQDFVTWERDTIQPKYGLPYGVQYTWTIGVAELYDYDWFFGGFPRPIDAVTAKSLGAKPGQDVVVYPRRAFDLWNTRYFIVPAFPNGWNDENRGYATFLTESERIYPPAGMFENRGGSRMKEEEKAWVEHEDLQVFRNRSKLAQSRAWLVHAARYFPPLTGLNNRSEREAPMEEMLFQDDLLWNDHTLTVYDPSALVWLDSDKRQELRGYLPGHPPSQAESVSIAHYGPQRVVLDVVLESPGIVILADVYYPGWRLTIDGRDAPIYRANRMMRGAAVRAGRHRLVYSYQPHSFRLGARISVAGLAVLGVLGVGFSRWTGASRAH